MKPPLIYVGVLILLVLASGCASQTSGGTGTITPSDKVAAQAAQAAVSQPESPRAEDEQRTDAKDTIIEEPSAPAKILPEQNSRTNLPTAQETEEAARLAKIPPVPAFPE